MPYLIGFGLYVAIVAALTGLWFLKCAIQDRIHARQTVAKWDAIVRMNDPRLFALRRDPDA